MTASSESMREKLHPTRTRSEDPPYDEDGTEYLDVTGPSHNNTTTKEARHEDDEIEEYESFHEYSTTLNPYKKPIYRRKRYIVGCLIGTVFILAIFIPLFLKFAVKPIAQLLMNGATMTVVQLNMTEPQETQMTVSVLASVGGIPKIFSATLEFTDKVEVFWEDWLIGSMTLGTVHVSGGKGDILQSTTFQIMNTTAFAEFAKVMLAADGFAWTMKSTATVKAFGQTISGLKIDKRLDMNGTLCLSNFAGINILSFTLPRDAPDGNGALVSIQATIPNPSPIGMVLGTITLDITFQSTYLGRVIAKNVTLIGGQPMALNLEGQLYRQTEPLHLAELSLLMSNYLADKPTMATEKGVSVFPDGVNAVSWLTDSITATTLTVPLKAVKPLDVIKNIKINDMNLVFDQAKPWSPTVISNSSLAEFKIPFDIAINITELANTTFNMAYNNVPFVTLSSAVWNQTASDMPNNKIVFSVPPSAMDISNQVAFTEFMTAVTQSPSASVDVAGSAQGVTLTSMGAVRLTAPLKTSLPLQGIDFSNQKPTVSNIAVVGGTTDYVTINAIVGLNNPSIFSASLVPVALQVKSTLNGTVSYVGAAMISNLILKPGMNNVPTTIQFKPIDKTFASGFLSAFVGGGSFVSCIYGDENVSPIASIVSTIKILTLTTTLPGMIPAPQIITGGTGTPSLGNILGPRQVPLTVTAKNPLASTLWIQVMTASVFWEGNYFRGVDKVRKPFEIPAGIVTTSPSVQLQCPLVYQFALFLVTQFIPKNMVVLTGGTVIVDITATFEVTIGGGEGVGYVASLDYKQTGVPAYLKIDYSFAGLMKRSMEGDSLSKEVFAIGDGFRSEAVTVGGASGRWVTPSKRRALLSKMSDDELYKSVVALLGREYAPRADARLEYVAWLEKALRALYPEHQ
ncbi:hypothetical protein BGW39_011411 [Mortierella sp. 14UC]|nr:hypothetical protein BGW39_011411 [Mortierella sp. 14UC]